MTQQRPSAEETQFDLRSGATFREFGTFRIRPEGGAGAPPTPPVRFLDHRWDLSSSDWSAGVESRLGWPPACRWNL